MDRQTSTIIGLMMTIPVFLMFLLCFIQCIIAFGRSVTVRIKERYNESQNGLNNVFEPRGINDDGEQDMTAMTVLPVQPARAYRPTNQVLAIRIDSTDSLKTLVEEHTTFSHFQQYH